MASLVDLQRIFNPSTTPAGFRLADLNIQGNLAQGQAGINRERVLRDFNQFNLPGLLGAQAARGAFHSSATDRKREQLAHGAGDQLVDIQFALGQRQADLAANALLAKTGITLGRLG